MALALLAMVAACSGEPAPSPSDDLANIETTMDNGFDATVTELATADATNGEGNTAGPDEGNAAGPIDGDMSAAAGGGASVDDPYREPYRVVAPDHSGRQLMAPNGVPWPSGAGYVSGYGVLRGGGLSSVTVDNSRNGDNVFVKLVAVDAGGTTPVRHIFIPAHASFTMASVSVGTYDVRFMNLSNGGLARTEQFTLTETATAGGTQYRDVRMTLFNVTNGNARIYPLEPGQF